MPPFVRRTLHPQTMLTGISHTDKTLDPLSLVLGVQRGWRTGGLRLNCSLLPSRSRCIANRALGQRLVACPEPGCAVKSCCGTNAWHKQLRIHGPGTCFNVLQPAVI